MGYWLIRYYVYFREINNKGFKSAFYKRLDTFAIKIARNRFFKNTDLLQKEFPERDGCKPYFINPSVKSRSLKVYRVAFIIRYGKSEDTGQSVTHRITIEKHFLILPIFRSFIYVNMHTKFFTEYVLPFIICSSPIIYKLNQWLKS